MSRLRWPDSTNSVSEKPGTIHYGVLEYLKVFLASPVLGAVVTITFIIIFREQVGGLINRLAMIRFLGSELSAPQVSPKPVTEPDIPPGDQPTLPADIGERVREMFNAERTRRYLWEYRYLNLFLVAQSQRVLEWFAPSGMFTTYAQYDSLWATAIPDPNQRRTIISVLETHSLVQHQNDNYAITPKGLEYLEWRHRI